MANNQSYVIPVKYGALYSSRRKFIRQDVLQHCLIIGGSVSVQDSKEVTRLCAETMPLVMITDNYGDELEICDSSLIAYKYIYKPNNELISILSVLDMFSDTPHNILVVNDDRFKYDRVILCIQWILTIMMALLCYNS